MKNIITPACVMCHKTSQVMVTDEEYSRLKAGLLIQNALPDRDSNFREIVQSGIHPDCWDKIFSHDQE